MDDGLIQQFLEERQQAFRSMSDEVAKEAEDQKNNKPKEWQTRWSTHMQLCCGSKGLWEIVSFTGRFDAAALEKLGAPEPEPGEDTAEPRSRKNRLVTEALEANSRMRLGEKYEAVRQAKGVGQLTAAQQALADAFVNGTLSRAAKEATIASGPTRRVMKGRSVGSYVPPCLEDLEIEG